MDLKKLKFLSILLAVVASFAFGGCSDDDTGKVDNVQTVTCGEGTTLSADGTTCTSNAGEPITCGAGTQINADGTACESTGTGTEITCGAGTVLNADGIMCVDDGTGTMTVTCGAGTVLSADGTTCEPDGTQGGLECGMGTELNDAGDMCIPICGAGSMPDATTGECIVDLEVTCDEGTFVSQNNTCVDWEQLLRESAIVTSSDNGATQDDPFLFAFTFETITVDFFGTPVDEEVILTSARVAANSPNSLSLPTVGETIALEGTIEDLGDITNDGSDDQDFDVYMFEAQAGQTLRVTANNKGLIAPVVELYKLDGVDASTDLSDAAVLPDAAAYFDAISRYRLSPTNQFVDPSREYFISEGGVYFLTITSDSHTPFSVEPSFNGDREVLVPGESFGGDNFGYLVAIENIGIIDPLTIGDDASNVFEIAPENDAGNIWSGTTDEYVPVASEIALVRMKSDQAGGEPGHMTVKVNSYDDEAVEGILSVFNADLSSPPGALPWGLSSGAVFTIPVPAEGIIINHDFFASTSAPKQGYDVAFTATPVLTPNTPATFSVPDTLSHDAVISVPSGEVLEVTASAMGDGVDGVLAFFTIDETGAPVLVACSDLYGGLEPGFCLDGQTSGALHRYFETEDGSAIDVIVTMLDFEESAGAGSFDFTLEAKTFIPADLVADPTMSVVGLTGSVDGTNNPVRWAKISTTAPGSLTATFDPETDTTGVSVELYSQASDSVAFLETLTIAPAASEAYAASVSVDTEVIVRVAHTEGGASDVNVTLDLIEPDFFVSSQSGAIIDVDGTTDIDITETLSVADACATSLSSVTVDVNISHTYRGDLEITLMSPAGTSVLLQASSLSDSAADVIGNYPGTLTPAEDLSILAGEQITGDWTLSIVDTYPTLDSGTVNSIGLNFFCQ